MRRLLSSIFAILTIATIGLYSQSSGTPSTLRVRVDANGYLVVASAAQTNPVTSGTFSSRVLKTDASGNLLIVNTGGASGPTSYAASTCAAPGISLTGDADTGIAFTATPSILDCVAGNTIGTWDVANGLTIQNPTTQTGLLLKGSRSILTFADTTGVIGGQIDTAAGIDPLGVNLGLQIRTPGVTGNGGISANWTVFRFNGAANKIYLGDTGSVSWIQSGHTLQFRSGVGSTPDATGTSLLTITSAVITSLTQFTSENTSAAGYAIVALKNDTPLEFQIGVGGSTTPAGFRDRLFVYPPIGNGAPLSIDNAANPNIYLGGDTTTSSTITVGWDVIGIGGGQAASADANMKFKAGTTGRVPIQLQSGPLKTSPVVGGIEFLTDTFYGTITTGTARQVFFTTPSLTVSSTAPIIASGFGTSPSVTVSNGTAAFLVNVGTGGTASNGVITMPAATTGYNCSVENRTGVLGNYANQRTVQIATTTTSVTIENQTISTGAALAWTASDVIALMCMAY